MPSTSTKQIGILTGGGDCPGLNAVIRAVVKDAAFHSIPVIGFEDGFQGLIENRFRTISAEDVSGILTFGGTILGTCNRTTPVRYRVATSDSGDPVYADVTDRCLATYRHHSLDALVVIGGDGSMTIADHVARAGGDAVNVIGIPKTIDNDLFGTDLTFGFLTAVATATDALDRVHTTAASHHRALFVEVMGRNAGWIALHAGVASGADVILIPEIPFSLASVEEAIITRSRLGKRYSVVCIAEGARPTGGSQVVQAIDPTMPDPIRLGGIAKYVSDHIERETRVECRHVVLGHVQRGGGPIAADRVLATQFGHHAMSILRAGVRNRMVAMTGLRLTDVPLSDCAGKQRLVPIDHPLVAAARAVYTRFGE